MEQRVAPAVGPSWGLSEGTMEGSVAYEDAFPQLSRDGKQVAQDNSEVLGKDLPKPSPLSFKEALNASEGESSTFPQQPIAFNEAGKLKLWGKRGLAHVSPAGPKRILLKFENESMLDGILNRSDWHVAGCPILLRKWSVGIQLSDQELRTVPCWVQLSGIPLELWHKEGFLYLASVLGVPLKVDGRSERMANIGTARIQVNCSAVKELQRKIEVEGEEGANIQIDVHYENVPLRCKECQVFGHSDSQCLRQRARSRSRSRSRGPGARSASTRGRKRNGNLERVNSLTIPQSGTNTKAIMWREMGNGVSPAGSVSSGNAAEPWRGFNTIPIGHTDNLNGELYYNIPLENRWSIVPYEGDTGENRCLEVNPILDKEVGEFGISMQSSLNELLTEDERVLEDVHENGREGAIVLGGNYGILEDSLLGRDDIECGGQQPEHELNPTILRDGIVDKPLFRGKDFSISEAWMMMYKTGVHLRLLRVGGVPRLLSALHLCPRVLSCLCGMARRGKNARGTRRGRGKESDLGESSNSVRKEAGSSFQEPIIVEDAEESVEEVFWKNPNPYQEDDGGPPLNVSFENFLRWCVENLPDEDSDESDPSEDEFDAEEFARLRAMQKGKLLTPLEDSESEGVEENFKSCNSDIEVTDDTVCTLFPDGSYIAHKEAGLLLGVVDRVGERVKLEWRHSYRSVWVRRVNKWTCYPKPGFLDDNLNRNELPEISTDLAPPAVPFRKRVRDWFVRETRDRKRLRWMRRIVRHRGMRQVKEVGVQTDIEMHHDGSGSLAGQPGNQVENASVEVVPCSGPRNMGAKMELMDEELMDWGPGAWYYRDVDMEMCCPIASTGFEVSVRIPNGKVNLRQLAEKFLHDLAMEEDQIARILKCQALRLIAAHLPGTSLEFREIISELTLTTRTNVNRRTGGVWGRGWVSCRACPLSFKEAIELTTSAIIDSRRQRPPALTSSMVRKVMVRLELIDQEESPILRLKECRELRQILHGLEGVPAYIGDLHEELYTLALMEVPDGNWQADPVIPASPSSDNSSTDQDPWLDECDPCYPSTPEEDGSYGSED
ncbi:hypothetical protein MLD38_016450 [Melastoma candidum]|uniref:Uncharacterized protein n=1 Tax=Melastoma candidum TaxID=119954 RepID=A0ACB9RJA9_9MYRT|nr:hypothetical protein MLD38_016450 [Melastoma candidum]